MIIDLILDRQDGFGYNPHDFYFNVLEYNYLTPEASEDITRAMDGGTEYDVKCALARYIINQGYNLDIITYINSVNWLEGEEA